MDENKKIYEIAKFFLDEKVSTHIVITSGWFYNGVVLKLSDKILVIDDEKIGSTVVFLEDIVRIVHREEKNE